MLQSESHDGFNGLSVQETGTSTGMALTYKSGDILLPASKD